MNTKNKKNIFGILFSVIIGILVILFISKVTNVNIIDSIKKIKITDILITFLIYSCSYIIDSIRYKIILKPFKIKIKFLDLLNNNIMGYVFSSITPLAAGGQPFQIYDLKNKGLSYHNATNIVVSRFLEAMFLNLGISIFSYKLVINSLINTNISNKLINVGLLVSLSISLLFLLIFLKMNLVVKFINLLENKKNNKLSKFGKNLDKWTTELKNSIKFLWSEKIIFMIIDIILGFAVLIIQAYSFYYMLDQYAVINEIPYLFWKVFGGITLLNMVVYYIPTPGASGSIEGSYQLLFSSITNNPSGVLIAVLGWRFAIYYMQIIFGLLYSFFYNIIKNKKFF